MSHLYIAAVDVHTTDHTALRGDIRPIDHLLPVVEVQSHSIVQPLIRDRERDELLCSPCIWTGLQNALLQPGFVNVKYLLQDSMPASTPDAQAQQNYPCQISCSREQAAL